MRMKSDSGYVTQCLAKGRAHVSQVTELCPNCGHLEAYSEEKQLRSADEGSTILYSVRVVILLPDLSSTLMSFVKYSV